MSTEIKNTLFRFVTMRAPELSDESLKEKRFVFRNAQVSYFDQAVNSNSSAVTNWQAMQTAARTFTPFTEETLKAAVDSNFIEFSIWIARNKHSFKASELLSKLNALTDAISSETLTLLWDNLFYQVVTQKDFYVKETIMQLLIANHIYVNIASIDEEYHKAKESKVKNPVFETELIKNIVAAKVVLPKELFDEKQTIASMAKKRNAKDKDPYQPVRSVPSEEMKQFLATAEAKSTIDRHLKLKSELLKIEKYYQKEYQDAHDEAMEEYQAIIEPILQQYNKEVEESKKEWCGIRNPEVPYDANDPCNQPPTIPQPKLPKFEFDLKSEPDLEYLQSLLTEDSFDTLLEVLEIDTEIPEKDSSIKRKEALERLQSQSTVPFSQVYEAVQVAVTDNSQTIINNTPSQNTTSVSVGGVIVPVIIPDTAAPFSYQVCAQKHTIKIAQINKTYVDFHMTLKVPDATWEVTDVQTSFVRNSELNASFLFSQSRNGNTIILSRLFTEQKLPLATFESGIPNVMISVSFSNGAIGSFSSGLWNSISCLSGILTPVEGFPDSSGDDSTEIENSFIPSGFGVKQLGIADYKKVEQTVQGYIEGDVAHIENIMAREFKEKATRKLRRSENTTSISSETEREQLSDTTSTNRFEMQSEVAKVLQEDKDFTAGASFEADLGKYRLGTNVNMATHSTKEESNLQAITQAKEVTERAMERIVTKVKEERITKIVEEFEENNKHGFDNTKGDKHVVGVFRWVDKIYKNQVLNFGKRLMFEFMVPEPAKLHLLGMSENKELTSLVKPIDPRKFADEKTIIPLNIKDYSLVNENTAKYWAGIYNADVKPMPDNTICISHSFQDRTLGIDDSGYGRYAGAYSDDEFKIPENYYAISIKGHISTKQGTHDRIAPGSEIYVCGQSITNGNVNLSLNKIKDKITISAISWDVKAISGSLVATCELLPEAKIKWQQETFKAIIDAYEASLTTYNQKLAEENAIGIQIKGENPGFYRQIENTILRKNCISYIIDQNNEAKRTYGRNMFKPLNDGIKRQFNNHEVNVGPELDDYAAFAKFIEQAFEWEIMSYNFYPYYWGAKTDWSTLYQYDNNDPLFRSFMQAGMARVIVTVRPGFEEAVNYYMQTGQIWNGGEVPVIENKLFMSIVDELRQTLGQKEGKAWATRLPTALTILQAQTIGLTVEKALPFDEDLSDFENPEDVPQSDALDFSDAQLGTSQKARIVGKIKGNENKEAKIVLKNVDATTRDLAYCDADGNWELNDIPAAKYQLLLDANNDFPATEFEVTQGSKELTVELSADQTLEINLELKKL